MGHEEILVTGRELHGIQLILDSAWRASESKVEDWHVTRNQGRDLDKMSKYNPLLEDSTDRGGDGRTDERQIQAPELPAVLRTRLKAVV